MSDTRASASQVNLTEEGVMVLRAFNKAGGRICACDREQLVEKLRDAGVIVEPFWLGHVVSHLCELGLIGVHTGHGYWALTRAGYRFNTGTLAVA